jgi:lipoate-protein ligase A
MARAAVAHAFGDPKLEAGVLTDAERTYAEEFRTQFDNDTWLFGKSERNRFAATVKPGDTVGHGREKAVGGMIWATLVQREGRIRHAIVNGDWHPRPIDSVAWLEEALVGVPAEEGAVRACVEAFLGRDDVEFAGVQVDDLMSAFVKALAETQPVVA